MACDVSPPPVQYSSGPTRQYSVHYLTVEEMNAMFPPFKNLMGETFTFCAITAVWKNPIVIYVRKDVASEELLAHEIGHVRGWRHKKIQQAISSTEESE